MLQRAAFLRMQIYKIVTLHVTLVMNDTFFENKDKYFWVKYYMMITMDNKFTSTNFDQQLKPLSQEGRMVATNELLKQANDSKMGRSVFFNKWCNQRQINYKTLMKYLYPDEEKTINRKQLLRIETEISDYFKSVTCRAISPDQKLGGDDRLTLALASDKVIIEYIAIKNSRLKENLVNIKKTVTTLEILITDSQKIETTINTSEKLDANIEFLNDCEKLLLTCKKDALHIHAGAVPEFLRTKADLGEVTVAIIVVSAIPSSRKEIAPADLHVVPDFVKIKDE